MKTIRVFLLFLLFLPAIAFSQERYDLPRLISAEDVQTGVMIAFPEAYSGYFQIMYVSCKNMLIPETMQFKIAQKQFKRIFDQAELESHVKRLMILLELDMANPKVSYSEMAWYNAPDRKEKIFRDINIQFHIECK